MEPCSGRRLGPRRNSSIAACRLALAAPLGLPQLCRHPCQRHHPHHHPQCLLLLRPQRRQRLHQPGQHQSVLSIPSIVLWMQRTRGRRTKRHGAAEFITVVAPQQPRRSHRSCRQWCSPSCPSCRQLPLTHTIVRMVSPIGKQVGLWARSSGAAGCTERVALAKQAVAVRPWAPPRLHMTATLDSPIGWPAGVSPRRRGAVRMQVKAAHHKQEGAHELCEGLQGVNLVLALEPSSGMRSPCCCVQFEQAELCAGASRHLLAHCLP